MERRKESKSKSSPLPVDYLQMVQELFHSHFDEGLKIYQSIFPSAHFEAQGEVYSDEIVLAISLTQKESISATSFYASTDFDPKASVPNIQDLLSACVDGIGTILSSVLDPENPEKINLLATESLSSLENIPFLWTEIEANKKKIFVKVDKANLQIDNLADQWLKKHDPNLQELEEEEHKETEKLFFTGASAKKSPTSH